MISWLGVRFGPLSVIVLVLFAVGWSGVDPVVFLIVPRTDRDSIDMWGSAAAVPLIVICGILADKYGRLWLLAGLVMAALLIESLFLSFMATMTISMYVNIKFVTVAITGLALLMAYESVPLKFRLPVLVGLSIPASLGSAICEVAAYALDNMMVTEELADPEIDLTSVLLMETVDEDLAVKDRRVLLMKQVVTGALLLASFLAIVIVLRRQVGLWRIFKEASSKLYVTMVAQKGKQETGFDAIPCPVPVTRTEFVVNISNETVRHSWSEIVRNARGPLVLLLVLAIAEGLSYNSLYTYEVLATQVVFGDSVMGFVPRVVSTVMMMISTLIYVVVWFFCKDVRYVAFAGLVLCAVSSFIALAAPLETMIDAMRNDEMEKVDAVAFTAGYLMATTGLAFASASLRMFVLDLLPTKMRATGILTWLALVSFSNDLVPLLGGAGWTGAGVDIFSAFFIGIASIVGLAAVYTTNWFNHSLVCRDPELDAQWLVKELSPANKFTYTSFP